MAYRRKTTSKRRAPARRRSTSSYSPRRRTTRRSSARRSPSRTQTVRIVLETAGTSEVARPADMIGMKAASAPKKKRF